ncbi:TorD/DmsD family molecular chaperone [Desulfitobacterium metallireducens]|uniref:Component of anaerobic dehydrogenase n=1 Tax=Desulfitobacterium metallireducens DSM 15288 TaxID=871968 RepID=W0EF97_9FIRM|nr:molecular chaperone TorD family protein [Desulfitobacterium metallireducens]AHF07731.1 component of anaerobic dehydrogenase [Desulfitobacterium metallireducens DSM 15288]
MFEMDENVIDRARGYEVLAEIFLKEPSTEGMEGLKAWTDSGSTEKLLELKAILEKIQNEDSELMNLTQEYYDLFFVPVSGRFIPPFESTIRGAKREKGKRIKYGAHWGMQAHQLAALYEKVGFDPGTLEIFEPLKETKIPDHLGLELLFIAYLCRLEDKAAKSGQEITGLRQLQNRMLNDHLLGWLPQFTGELVKLETSGFYSYFAILALELCQEESKSLNETF